MVEDGIWIWYRTVREVIMNYEVMCMVDFVGVVDRTYFETYDEAAAWSRSTATATMQR